MTGAEAAPRKTSLFRTVMRNAAVLLGGKSINAPLSLAYMAIAARALGAHDLGVVVLINAFAQSVGFLVRFDSWQAVIHYGAGPLGEGRREDFHRILRFSLRLDLLAAAAGVAIALAGAAFAGDLLGWTDAWDQEAMLYCTSVAFMVVQAPVGVLRIFDRFDLLAAQTAVASAVRLVGAALVWALHGDVAAMLAAWYAGTVAAFVFLVVAGQWELHRKGHGFSGRIPGPLHRGFPGLWRFVWATNASASLDKLLTQFGTLAVGALLDPASAALFRIARQVADAIAKPAKLVIPALYPELARLRATGDNGKLRRLALQVGLAGGAVATGLLVVVAVVGKPLLGLVLGPAFVAAAGVMTWLTAAAAIEIWSLPLEPLLISTGKAGAAVRVRMVVSLAFLAVLVPATKVFGLPGAGAASVAASLMTFAGMLLAVLRWSRRLDARTAGSSASPALDPDTPAPSAAVADGDFGYRP
jgi:O-antigen/teichoic acid export membrane protein